MKMTAKYAFVTEKDNYTYVTDKDKTGQITEFRLTYGSLVLAKYCFTNKIHYGYKNVSLTQREDGQWAVNWDRK
jgi:hypothetical protein